MYTVWLGEILNKVLKYEEGFSRGKWSERAQSILIKGRSTGDKYVFFIWGHWRSPIP